MDKDTKVKSLSEQLAESHRREYELAEMLMRIQKSENPFDMQMHFTIEYSSLLKEGVPTYIAERIIEEVYAAEKKRRGQQKDGEKDE